MALSSCAGELNFWFRKSVVVVGAVGGGGAAGGRRRRRAGAPPPPPTQQQRNGRRRHEEERARRRRKRGAGGEGKRSASSSLRGQGDYTLFSFFCSPPLLSYGKVATLVYSTSSILQLGTSGAAYTVQYCCTAYSNTAGVHPEKERSITVHLGSG